MFTLVIRSLGLWGGGGSRRGTPIRTWHTKRFTCGLSAVRSRWIALGSIAYVKTMRWQYPRPWDKQLLLWLQ
jgi:hypothetical protein